MGTSALRNDEAVDVAEYALKHPEEIKFVVLQGGKAVATATAALAGGTSALTATGLILAAGATVFYCGVMVVNMANQIAEVVRKAMPYKLIPPFKFVAETKDYITFYDVNGIRRTERKDALDAKFNARRLAPNSKHGRVKHGESSADPFYYCDDNIALAMLVTAYGEKGKKQLTNYWRERKQFIKFQPDNTGGYHAYCITPGEVTFKVLIQMYNDGLITYAEKEKYRKGKHK
jgi:hypothetical protein